MKNLFIAACFLSIITSWFSVGRYHSDEQFQILEFAGLKKGMNQPAEMPWEFHKKIRPAIQVGFAYTAICFLEWVNVTDPFIWAFILRLVASVLGLYASYRLLMYYKNKISDVLFRALCFLSLFYCFIPYFHARYSSESISSSLFFIGLFQVLSFFEKRTNYSRLFLFATISGLSGVVRLQADFLLFGFILWIVFIKKENIKTLSIILAGILLANLTGIICDKWFYGTWEITAWNYVYENIVLNKASEYGVEPFWFYFERIFLNAIPPFSLILIFCFIYLFFTSPKSYLTWICIPFLLGHFFTAHKELRFLYVLIPIIPLVCLLVYHHVLNLEKSSKLKAFLVNKKFRWFKFAFLGVNSTVLIVLSVIPADSYTPVLKFIYENYNAKPTFFVCGDEHYNVYSKEVALNFYRSRSVMRSKITIEQLKDFNLPDPFKFIYIGGRAPVVPSGLNAKLVFTSVPGWLFYFNFNHWIEREGITSIYEISKNKSAG